LISNLSSGGAEFAVLRYSYAEVWRSNVEGSDTNMSGLEMTLLATLAAFGLLGVYWGLIRQVLSLAGLVAGIVLAGKYGSVVAGWLTSFTSDLPLANTMGFIFVLIAVSAAASLIASLLRFFVGLLFLGWLDHVLGGVLGVLQAVLAIAAVMVVAVTFPQPSWTEAIQSSQIALLLLRVGSLASTLLPEMFGAAVHAALGS
jgi:membrane protein required for colicin V production